MHPIMVSVCDCCPCETCLAIVLNSQSSFFFLFLLLLLFLFFFFSLQAYCMSPALEVPTCTTRTLPPPTPSTMWETSSRERGNYGREMSGEFCHQIASSTLFEGIFYMPQICNMGPTALLPLQRKACWGFFRPEKYDGFSQVRTRELEYQRAAC
jgi:hypothetical protein